MSDVNNNAGSHTSSRLMCSVSIDSRTVRVYVMNPTQNRQSVPEDSVLDPNPINLIPSLHSIGLPKDQSIVRSIDEQQYYTADYNNSLTLLIKLETSKGLTIYLSF